MNIDDCFLPLAISVDGPDGAGKSTIVSHVSKKYHAISPLPAIGLGLMPFSQDERLDWYKFEDPIVVAKIILASQKKRFSFLQEYAEKLHFKQSDREVNPPSLIILDRGPISAKAYSYACLRLNTDLPCHTINQIINLYFDTSDLESKIFYIDLYTKTSDAEKFFERATNIIDNRIDLLLIRGQIEYYQKFFTPRNSGRTLKLNPFDPMPINLKKVEDFIDLILQKNAEENKQKKQPTTYLTSLIQKIIGSKRHGNLTIYGEIITQGYSNSLVNIKYDDSCDLQILKSLENVAPLETSPSEIKTPNLSITPQCLMSDEPL